MYSRTFGARRRPACIALFRNLDLQMLVDLTDTVPERPEMPADFTNPEQAITPDPESSMFAPTPLWDRAPKKRRGGARQAAARQISDPAFEAGEPGAGAGVIGATTAAEPLDASYETQPARSVRQRRSG